MRQFKSPSIQRKLIIAVLCTSLLGLGMVCAAFELYERGSFRRALTEELTTLADTVGANSAASLAFDDRKSARDVLAGLSAEHHIVAACLYDSRGTIFAEYRRPGIGTTFQMPVWREDGATFSPQALTLNRTVSMQGEKIGGIAIISDLEALRAKMRQYTEISALVLLLSVLATLLVSSRLFRLITEPILALAEVAGRVSAQENYSLRAIPQTDDEVGKLVNSFNQMLERIQERDTRLKEAKDELEVRVEARTKELQSEVAERLRAQEALSQERKVLRALIDNVPDYMYVKDTNSRFLVANLSVARQMGAKTPEELLGKSDFDFYPCELATTFYEDEQRVIRSGLAEINREETGLDPQGNVSQVLTTQVPLRDKNGRVTGLAGIGRDITQLKKAQAEMQEAREAAEAASLAAQERNELVKLLLDSTAEAIYGIDLHGNCTMCNRAALRMLGYGEQELLGKNMHDLIHHTRADGTPYPVRECRIFKAFLSVQGSHVDDEVLWRKDGTSFPAEYWSFPVHRGEQVLGSVVTFIDITERKETENRLVKLKETAEAASRAKSEFLANMSHEIRTPLNGIMGMTDLALETDLTREQREYLETVKTSSDSLLTVINDILDFSKIEAGKIDLEVTDFDLRDSLETTLKTLAVRADEKGLELLCEVAAEVPEVVRGDATRLRQVVVNLVGNAIKFTNQGEVAVKVQVEAQEGSDLVLRFTVWDTGIGIPENKREKIFDPFAQADTSTTRRYGGTGLGLTISLRLVRMMGGKIWVESEEGRGSQFHFTVRMEAADHNEIKIGSAAPPEILRGVRVLVVDDNRTNRRILEGMLKRWEMRTVCVGAGEEALAELAGGREARDPFKLIVTDMHMPKMDGFELVEQIRRQPELSTATIMMLTSAGHRGDAERCQELGVSAYLLKPIRQSELREAIARVLGARGQEGKIPLITRFSLGDARDSSDFLRVLVAEDNPVNQRLIVRLLEKRGHRVVLAENGRQALAALEKESFDVVLMDVQMPEMDGFEATSAIRMKEKSSRSHQTIIALTAHAMKGDPEKCLAQGMDGYLSKPIRPQELDEVLARCTVHPRVVA